MPRRGPAFHRETAPDPVYQNPLVTQLINKVLLDGKKNTAERIVYKALEQISERTANDPVITLKKAVENVRPMLEVRSRRVGGANYQVPVEVRAEPRHHARVAVARQLRRARARALDGGPARRRDHGRLAGAGSLGQAARGHAQDGRGEQGVRALPVVIRTTHHEPGPSGPGVLRGGRR